MDERERELFLRKVTPKINYYLGKFLKPSESYFILGPSPILPAYQRTMQEGYTKEALSSQIQSNPSAGAPALTKEYSSITSGCN